MEAKKILGIILVLGGAVGLVVGVLGIFQGTATAGINAYAWAILGVIFFLSGIGLMKSVGTTPTETES